jgi:hypothetical protein
MTGREDLTREPAALTAAAAEIYARPFTLERIAGQRIATAATAGPSDN